MSKVVRITPAMMVVTYKESESMKYRLYCNGTYEGDFTNLYELMQYITGLIIYQEN